MTDATEEVPFNTHLTELIEQSLPAHTIEGLMNDFTPKLWYSETIN